MNYISINDITNWDSESDSEKTAICDQAEDTIERITHDYFYPKPFDIKVNGSGNSRIFMPFIQNVLHISKVEVFDTDLSYFDFDKFSLTGEYDDLGYVQIFQKGINNVRIKGTKGWAEKITITGVSGDFEVWETITGGTSEATAVVKEVNDSYLLIAGKSKQFTADETITGGTSEATATTTPSENNPPLAIKNACIKLAMSKQDSTLYTYYSDLESERLGDYSYKRGSGAKFLTGIVEVDRLIKPYILTRPLL